MTLKEGVANQHALAIALKLFLMLAVLVAAAKLWVATWRYEVFSGRASGFDCADLELERLDHWNRVVALIGISTLALTGIGWFARQWRAYANLALMGAGKCYHSVTWATLSWLVPIVGYYQPYLALGEIWRQSSRYNDEESIASTGFPLEVVLWWFVSVPTRILDLVSERLGRSSKTVDEIARLSHLDTVAGVSGLFATVLALYVVHRIDELQIAAANKESSPSADIAPVHDFA